MSTGKLDFGVLILQIKKKRKEKDEIMAWSIKERLLNNLEELKAFKF